VVVRYVRSLLLGLDVSPKRLGWGLVDLVSGEAVACGCEAIELPTHDYDHERVHHALRAIDVSVDDQSMEIQAVYVEQPGLPPISGTKSAYNAGRAVQSIHDEVQRRWPHAPIEFLMPTEWRKLAGLPGNAKKPEVMIYSLELLGAVPGATRKRSQDAADGLLIAVAGQRRNQENWDRSVERSGW
jgi:Holliday junction resolvasome RuvABC endonuclease subunit